MTIPHIPAESIHVMPKDIFAIYLELCIEWNKEIRDNSRNSYDYTWKQGQIDLLQEMVNEIDGIRKPTFMEQMIVLMRELEKQ
jgi:hypothetical protein